MMVTVSNPRWGCSGKPAIQDSGSSEPNSSSIRKGSSISSAGLPMIRLSFTPAPSVAGTPATFFAMYRILISGIGSVGQRLNSMCGRHAEFQAGDLSATAPVAGPACLTARSSGLPDVPAVDLLADRIHQRADEPHRVRIRRPPVHLAFACFVKQAGPEFS